MEEGPPPGGIENMPPNQKTARGFQYPATPKPLAGASSEQPFHSESRPLPSKLQLSVGNPAKPATQSAGSPPKLTTHSSGSPTRLTVRSRPGSPSKRTSPVRRSRGGSSMSTATTPIASRQLATPSVAAPQSLLPPPPAGKKWRQAAVLVDEKDHATEAVYDPRIPANAGVGYPDLRYGPADPFCDRLRNEFKNLLNENNLLDWVSDCGIGEFNGPSNGGFSDPEPARVFVVILFKEHIDKWKQVEPLAVKFVAENISREQALEISSVTCPQFQVPIRFCFEDFVGYSALPTSISSVTASASQNLVRSPKKVTENERLGFPMDTTDKELKNANKKDFGRFHLSGNYEENTIGLSMAVVHGFGMFPRAGRSLSLRVKDLKAGIADVFEVEIASSHTVLPTIDDKLMNIQIIGKHNRKSLELESPARRHAEIEKETFEISSADLNTSVEKGEVEAMTYVDSAERARDMTAIQKLEAQEQKFWSQSVATAEPKTIGYVRLTSGIRTVPFILHFQNTKSETTFWATSTEPETMMDYALLNISPEFKCCNRVSSSLLERIQPLKMYCSFAKEFAYIPNIDPWMVTLKEAALKVTAVKEAAEKQAKKMCVAFEADLWKWDVNSFSRFLAHGIIHEFADPRPNELVILFGYKSGLKVGRINPKLKMFRKAVYRPDEESSTDKSLPLAKSHEIAVLSVKPGETFGDRGDSGQPVMNSKGQCVALVLGGPNPQNEPELFTYITPIRAIFEDLKRKFNLEVLGISWPDIDRTKTPDPDLTHSAPSTAFKDVTERQNLPQEQAESSHRPGPKKAKGKKRPSREDSQSYGYFSEGSAGTDESLHISGVVPFQGESGNDTGAVPSQAVSGKDAVAAATRSSSAGSLEMSTNIADTATSVSAAVSGPAESADGVTVSASGTVSTNVHTVSELLGQGRGSLRMPRLRQTVRRVTGSLRGTPTTWTAPAAHATATEQQPAEEPDSSIVPPALVPPAIPEHRADGTIRRTMRRLRHAASMQGLQELFRGG